MYWRDIILLCHCMSLVEEKWHVDSRARLVLVPLLGPHNPPDDSQLQPLPLPPVNLVLSVRQQWRQAWILMEQLWASLPHCIAFHKCRNSQLSIQDYLCLMVGHPFLATLGSLTVVLFVWTHVMDQAPRIVNPSEKSLSKYTFGGLTEILGCMWGGPQFHWTQRGIPLKSVSHRIYTFATLGRSSEL